MSQIPHRLLPETPYPDQLALLSLTRGQVAIVDNEDLDSLKKWKWHTTSAGYAARRERTNDGGSHILLLHRYIMNAPKGVEVDHINGNRLDNRRSNLRLCSLLNNRRNRVKSKTNTSGYIGVYWNKQCSKWCAKITPNRKQVHLGFFEDKEDAAKAYQAAAKLYFGEFARVVEV